MSKHTITCRFFSQEDLLGAGCLDINLAMEAAEAAIEAHDRDEVKDGELKDEDVHCDLVDLVMDRKVGRESPAERMYFNAVGLAYVDVAIAIAMYDRATDAGMGQDLQIQRDMIFEHTRLKDWVRI